MMDLPDKIKERLFKLRAEHEHYVEVKRIKGKYYAFEVTGGWNKQLKKRFKITHYLGRIKEDGSFKPANHRNQQKLKQTTEESVIKPDKYSKTIVRNLSMNGRMPTPTLAKKLGLSITATKYRITKVEETFGIKYVANIDTEKFGYLSYMLFIKFKDKRPEIEEIRKALTSEPMVQLVLLTSGKYDIIMYFIAKSNRDIALLVYNLRSKSIFSPYVAKWYITPFFHDYNFIPLRKEFFELLKTRVWKRTKETPRRRPEDISYSEYVVLYELNENGNAKFSEIDEKYKLNKGTAQYVYYKLKERGVIKTITIGMDLQQIKYAAAFLIEIINGMKFEASRKELLLEIINESAIVNKYSIVGDIESPYGVIFLMPVFSNDSFQKTEESIKHSIRGVNIIPLMVTNTVLGNLNYRKFDNKYSSQHRLLTDQYKMLKTEELDIYE